MTQFWVVGQFPINAQTYAAVAFFALQALVDFDRPLSQQEQATADQNEIASGDEARPKM